MAEKPYDVLKANEWEGNDGEVKNDWTNVGVAFEREKGGMTVEIKDGISVTGRLVIMPRKERAE